VDWPGEPEPSQTAEQAGQWMGAFLNSADAEATNHDYADTEDIREEQR
jgi:hypothetical protein